LRGKTAPPLRHTGCARFEILRDLFVALSLTRQQNNPCPLNETLLGFASPQPLLQNLTLIVKKWIPAAFRAMSSVLLKYAN